MQPVPGSQNMEQNPFRNPINFFKSSIQLRFTYSKIMDFAQIEKYSPNSPCISSKYL